MKLLEKFIYSGVLFLIIYVVVSVGLRVFRLTSDYHSHMIGGIIATVSGVSLFIFMLVKK